MMPLDRVAVFQFSLLVLAIPAQYFILKFMETSESQRSYALRNVLSSAVGLKNKYLTWMSWRQWCVSLLKSIRQESVEYGGQDDPDGESPAVEVIKLRNPDGMFGASPVPRSPRPAHVKYRVGQVIKHKIWGYRGVIIAWDTEAKAPAQWLSEMHPKNKKHWRNMPNYAILVDTRDRINAQMTYVPEENIQVIINTKIFHPNLDEYFEAWDGAQYLARPWMKALYPHD
ncbi:uncharacterized protein LOC135478946 [Liolophura sinensis]|uniref:uncharacterized protein LOC135478946 n=1 Tax=Liolophura sinensis TaxID=3198878 RepID=UPI0031599436